MESVISFPLGDFDVQLTDYTEVVDNGSSRRYSHQHCSSLQQLLRVKCWNQCMVGKKEGLEFDSEIRNSQSLDVHMYTNRSIIEEHQRKLVPVLYKNLISNDDIDNNGFKCLLYEKGGVFKPHRDTKISAEHFATMILMPPSDQSPHEGGVLRIRDHEDNWLEFRSDNLESWTVVIFHPLLEHEVTEVTSGRRLVFKQECLFDREVYRFFSDAPKRILNNVVCKLPSEIEAPKNERLTKFREWKEFIIEKLDDMDKFLQENLSNKSRKDYDYKYMLLEESVEKLELNNLPEPEEAVHEHQCETPEDVKYVIERINKNRESITIVVLNNYYPTNTVEWLYPGDYTIYETIKRMYPNTFLKNFTEKCVNGELCQYESLETLRERNGKIKTIRIGRGKKTGFETEYNDSDYDKVSWYSVTCLVVVS